MVVLGMADQVDLRPEVLSKKLNNLETGVPVTPSERHQQNIFLLFHTLQALYNLILEFSFWSWSPSTYK